VVRLEISDPERFALKNAVRAAIVAPAVFAFGLKVLDSPEVALFAGFGSLALIVFVDFSGDWRTRLTAYVALVAASAVLIAIGTLCSQTTALAVGAMAVVGFAVFFAGVFNGYLAAAQLAAILAFVLAAMFPADPGAIPDRLAGWGLGSACSLAAIFLLWPRRPRDQLRERAAAATVALAELLEVSAEDGAPSPEVEERLAELGENAYRAVAAVHAAFVATPRRPSGIGGRSAALGRLVDDLEWFDSAAREQAAGPDGEGVCARERMAIETAAPAALRAAAERLREDRPGDDGAELAKLSDAHAAIGAAFLAEVAAGPDRDATAIGAELNEVYRLRALAYGALQIGRHAIQVSGGSAPPDPTLAPEAGRLRRARRIASSHADMRSVWLRNSVRAAAGLAIAVLVARVTNAQNGFWVVLGTLSVLRSSALATGTTVVEAIAGTGVGILVGGLIVYAIGSEPALLWAVLPFAILLAAYSPRAISFAAGQAGFTVTVVVLFNLLNPVGWSVGVVRIEDVALGCGISLLTGFLVWPRGAAAVLREALGSAYVEAARYLDAAIVTRLQGAEEAPLDETAIAASESALRLDETVREYLGERGSAHEHLDALAQLVGGATRVRRVARLFDAAAELAPLAPPDPEAEGVEAVREPLERMRSARRTWFEGFGAAVIAGTQPPLPEPEAPPPSDGPSSRLAHRSLPALVLDGDRGPDGIPPGVPIAWAERHLEGLLELEPPLTAAARSVLTAPSPAPAPAAPPTPRPRAQPGAR
jgi:uncharacterized membrane protein YccC